MSAERPALWVEPDASPALAVVNQYLREREAVLQKGDRSGATLRDAWMGPDTVARDLAVESMLLAMVRQAIMTAEAKAAPE